MQLHKPGLQESLEQRIRFQNWPVLAMAVAFKSNDTIFSATGTPVSLLSLVRVLCTARRGYTGGAGAVVGINLQVNTNGAQNPCRTYSNGQLCARS